MRELSNGKGSTFSRPIIFYKLHLDIVLLVLVLLGISLRISSIIFIFLLSSNLTKIEDLIKCNLCENIIDKKYENDNSNDVSKEDRSKNSKKDGVINYINHSCEAVDKESESLDKEKDNLVRVESLTNNSVMVNNRDRKITLIDYYKKIMK